MNANHVLLVLATMMAVTFALRALPFIAAQWLTRYPFVQRLKEFLPLGIMTLLLLHSGMDAASGDGAGPLPVVTAVAVTVFIQWRLKHPLLSILCGTALFIVWRNRMI